MVKQELFNNKTKEKRGLYDPSYEHDACGVGMIVNIHGNKSHELVESALKVLENTMSLSYYREFPCPKKADTEQVFYFFPKIKKIRKLFLASSLKRLRKMDSH